MVLDIRRHQSLFDGDTFNTPIHVIGAGATGSWLVLELAKLGIKGNLIHVWDFDHVEEHNIPNQAYNLISYNHGTIDGVHNRADAPLEYSTHVRKPKIEALYQVVREATGECFKAHYAKYESQRLNGYVFLMVDSMEERKRIWEQAVKMKSAVKLLIEPRMGLDVGRVYNVEPTNMEHIRQYEDTFYTDEESEASACGTAQTVITTSVSTASWCARQLVNHVGEVELDNEILIDYKYNNIFTNRWEE